MKTPKHSLPSRPRRRLLAGLLALPAILALSTPSFAAPPTSEVNTSGLAVTEDTVKVGILHSITGTMAISEIGSVQAEKLAIEQINAQGGVLGRQIEYVQEDGASDWPTFAEKARKLLRQDDVAAIFGCWTSASRKAVLPVAGQPQHPRFGGGERHDTPGEAREDRAGGDECHPRGRVRFGWGKQQQRGQGFSAQTRERVAGRHHQGEEAQREVMQGPAGSVGRRRLAPLRRGRFFGPPFVSGAFGRIHSDDWGHCYLLDV